MGKIYVGQTDLTIKITTGKDLTTAVSAKLMYINPSKVTGNFTATIVDAPKGIIEYSVTSPTNFNVKGRWILWAEVTDDQGLVSIGEPSNLEFHTPGT